MSINLCLTVAQRRVRDYTDESDRLTAAHRDAMECRDCEEFLQHGINAYKWIKHADEFLREADYQGVAEMTQEVRDALDLLYKSWVSPCAFAERWIADTAEKGHEPDNLHSFREICEEARDVIQNREWRRMAHNTQFLLASQEPE